MQYKEFIDKVNELGFMAMSKGFLTGFPDLGHLTQDNQWHTGDPETDPWQWKDRAAAKKELAFGCVLCGHKGFISKRMYPIFYAAYHPAVTMRKRYEDGVINQTTWQLWQLFENNGEMDTAQLRKMLGVTKSKGASRVDSSIKELQECFYITVSGNRRKVSLEGTQYGWPSNTYTRVADWATHDWVDGANDIDPIEAREQILDIGVSIGTNIDRSALSKLLFKRTKL